jgi:hypothetical protein
VVAVCRVVRPCFIEFFRVNQTWNAVFVRNTGMIRGGLACNGFFFQLKSINKIEPNGLSLVSLENST